MLLCVITRKKDLSIGKFLWQVMYDATGVRLHAGRQAEVTSVALAMH